jgi:2-dehydro-3-deoxyphosphogluconate aldolase/(4S)-4-hydroxy-2-oxoglutarate aldolase
MTDLREILALGPVIPVLTIENADEALPIGEALLAGGVRVMEVTLRTPQALEAIKRLRSLDGAVVGAGTLLNAADVERAAEAGARFLVSPGMSESLVHAAERARVPVLPGVATASEVMRALDCGLETLKFFPAEAAGGSPVVHAFAGPFPNVRFCPTGGVTPALACAYLALSNVVCVGGSWLTPRKAIAERNWGEITRLAAEAQAFKR